jgi:hypothetical protein
MIVYVLFFVFLIADACAVHFVYLYVRLKDLYWLLLLYPNSCNDSADGYRYYNSRMLSQ